MASGSDLGEPAVVASTGVALYLTRDTIAATMRQAADFAPGSTLAMSFMVPLELVDADEQAALHGAERGAGAAGTPWISFFTPTEIIELARDAGFVVRGIDARSVRQCWAAPGSPRRFGLCFFGGRDRA